MSEDHPTQHSLLISSTAITYTDSEDEDDDALVLYPGLDDLWVSTQDPVLHARASPTWLLRINKRLGSRKTSGDRCKTCNACLGAQKITCLKQNTSPCGGCLKNHTCWGQRPCERWSESEKARHYTQFALQAYHRPRLDARTDVIARSQYRLDLDVNNGTMLKLHTDQQTSLYIGPPPDGLDGPWDQVKESLMIWRMTRGDEPMPDPNPGIEEHSEATVGKEPLEDEPLEEVMNRLIVELLPRPEEGEDEIRSPAEHIHLGEQYEYEAPEQDPKLVGATPQGATALRPRVRQQKLL